MEDRSREPEQSEYPLSRRQGLFWLDEQVFPQAHCGNLLLVVHLEGALDVPRFCSAWRETARVSDALQITLDPARPVQRFTGAEPPPLPVVPLQPGDLDAWIAERAQASLVGKSLPWQAWLLHLGADHHVFVLLAFHAVLDGVSGSLLLEQMAERYAGRVPPAPASFRECLRAEAAYRESPEGQADEAWWSRRLAGGAPPLRPYGLIRQDPSTPIARCWLEAPGLGPRVDGLARHEAFRSVTRGFSRLVVVATAFAAYLHRVTGGRRLMLSIPLANRSSRLARTPGVLMQPLFLPVTIEESDTFAALARRLRQDLKDSLAHRQWCNGSHGMDAATVNLIPAPPRRFAELEARVWQGAAPTLPGMRGGPGELRDTIGVWAEQDPEDCGLRIALDLHRATFDERLRRRATGHLARVLDALLADPDASLDAVALLDPEEAAAVQAAARGPEPSGEAPDLVERVALQARRTPDAVAIEGPDLTLRYDELERLSNRLARRLRSMGVVAGSLVAVAVPRGAGELASLLAVLKAGGAYVPLDDTHPLERIRVILEDAAPQLLIAPTASPLAAALPPGTALLHLDALRSAAEGFEDAPLGEPVAVGQVAYVLFTSGSTGRPKGVEIPRAALASFLRSMEREPGLRAGERLLAVTTTTFDIAGLELFLPLIVGGTVVVADRETAADPRRLRRAVEDGRIALMQATPATWRLLVEAGWTGDRTLRALCGGEAMPRELADQLLERCAELWNMYGPTETTVWSTLDRVTAGDRITIGRPIDWTQAYVLDAKRAPVPVGVIGELHLGGRGLALGYRGRPELTAQQFVANPFGEGRLYRTGDLARLLEDGRLECLGRVDHQVKLRGFRIELGEVESALRAVDGVKDAVVVADALGDGDARLVAYWVGPATREALLEAARSRLPSFMVPAAYVPMDTFPLTTSGKVDRRALPPAKEAAAVRPALRLPRNDLETRIAAIWAELLGVGAVDIDGDFFALGGTSMLAVEARARLEKELGIEIPLRVVFERPTVEGLAKHLGDRGRPDAPIVVSLRRGKDGLAPLFCLLGVQLYQDLALALETDHPVIGLHVSVPRRPEARRGPAVEEFARRYIEVLRERQAHGPYHLAGLCFGGVVAYEAARQLEAAGEEVALVALFDAILPRALTIDWPRRLAAGARSLLASPRHLARRLWDGLRRPRTMGPAAEVAGMPIEGREMLSELRRYERTIRTPLRTQVVAFRSEIFRWGAGITSAPDLGWSGTAERVLARDVHAEHLEIVRPPSVRLVAEVLRPMLKA